MGAYQLLSTLAVTADFLAAYLQVCRLSCRQGYLLHTCSVSPLLDAAWTCHHQGHCRAFQSSRMPCLWLLCLNFSWAGLNSLRRIPLHAFRLIWTIHSIWIS